MSTTNISGVVNDLARRAKVASRSLAVAPTAKKNEALAAVRRGLLDARDEVLAANDADMAAAAAAGLPQALVNRLGLRGERFETMVRGVEEVIALADPVGECIAEWSRPNGLLIRKVRVPFGVVGLIYEARPNVTIDAAILCLKTGNAVLLKGGKESERCNAVLARILREGLATAGLNADAVDSVPGGREGARALMEATGLVDVLLPRGGGALIRSVVDNARVPVIETGAGVCHVYVDRAADPDMATRITVNAKVSNPAVCNAAETLLVDAAIAPSWLPQAAEALQRQGVTLRGCPRTQELVSWVGRASEQDWREEYLDLILAVKVVDGLEAAIEHITTYGTHHSDTIVTAVSTRAERFMKAIDSAAVYWNASTRFTDGGEFGFGAEIGISTQKLHARGPMGLPELTSYKFLVIGSGQVR